MEQQLVHMSFEELGDGLDQRLLHGVTRCHAVGSVEYPHQHLWNPYDPVSCQVNIGDGQEGAVVTLLVGFRRVFQKCLEISLYDEVELPCQGGKERVVLCDQLVDGHDALIWLGKERLVSLQLGPLGR